MNVRSIFIIKLDRKCTHILLFFSLEKDPHDVTTKMTELKNHFQKARECVEKMPGIQCSKSEQLKQIDVLRSQLTIKTELLQKYKSYGVFHLTQ